MNSKLIYLLSIITVLSACTSSDQYYSDSVMSFTCPSGWLLESKESNMEQDNRVITCVDFYTFDYVNSWFTVRWFDMGPNVRGYESTIIDQYDNDVKEMAEDYRKKDNSEIFDIVFMTPVQSDLNGYEARLVRGSMTSNEGDKLNIEMYYFFCKNAIVIVDKQKSSGASSDTTIELNRIIKSFKCS